MCELSSSPKSFGESKVVATLRGKTKECFKKIDGVVEQMSYRITEIIEKTGYALMILQIRHHSHIYRLPIRLYIDEQQKEGIYDHVTHKKPIVSIEHMCVHFPGFDDSEYKHNEEDTMIAQLTTKLGNFIIDNDPDTVDIDSLNSTERMWVDFLIRARLPKAA